MQINETIVVPLLIAITELFKGVGLPKKYAAVISVLLGAMIGVFFMNQGDIKTGLLKGIIYGLSASGLYSGTKNVYQQIRRSFK